MEEEGPFAITAIGAEKVVDGEELFFARIQSSESFFIF